MRFKGGGLKAVPFVPSPSSGRRSSVTAWRMLARSISRAQNIRQVQSMMRRSILRTRARSSRQVQRAEGSKRWEFSLDVLARCKF